MMVPLAVFVIWLGVLSGIALLLSGARLLLLKQGFTPSLHRMIGGSALVVASSVLARLLESEYVNAEGWVRWFV